MVAEVLQGGTTVGQGHITLSGRQTIGENAHGVAQFIEERSPVGSLGSSCDVGVTTSRTDDHSATIHFLAGCWNDLQGSSGGETHVLSGLLADLGDCEDTAHVGEVVPETEFSACATIFIN